MVLIALYIFWKFLASAVLEFFDIEFFLFLRFFVTQINIQEKRKKGLIFRLRKLR